MRRALFALAVLGGLAALAVSCSYQPPSVPVQGDPTSVTALEGEWWGSYEGHESGRTGSIFFRLDAGADTARGDVLMAPLGPTHPAEELERGGEPVSRTPPPLVTIRFVRAAGTLVYGRLDEYLDPSCGCRVKTTFTGRLRDGEIRGTYTTVHLDGEARHGGTWNARRVEEAEVAVRPAAEGEPEPGGEGEPEPGEARPAEPVERPAEPGLTGPSEEEMVARGRALFADLGCARCHGVEAEGRVGPPLSAVTEHRRFVWIYHMILRPDSMRRDDPTARALYEEYGVPMPDRGASPWEALLLYEYLLSEVERNPPPENR